MKCFLRFFCAFLFCFVWGLSAQGGEKCSELCSLEFWEKDPSIEDVKRASGGNYNIFTDTGIPILHVAVLYEKKSIVEFFLDSGVDVNVRDSYGSSALHRAAQEGLYGIAELLLKNGANINAFDKNKITPLHDAVLFNQTKIVGLFLNNGSNIKASDNYGNTSLHFAALLNYVPSMKILLDYGADIEVENKAGSTPISLVYYRKLRSVYEGENNLDYFRLLFVKDFFEDYFDKISGWDYQGLDFDLVGENDHDFESLSFLISAGANLNVFDGLMEFSPLMWTVFLEDKNGFELLLKHRADLELELKDDGKVLSLATEYNKSFYVKQLVKAGANVNIGFFDVPIALASQHDNEEIVRVLLDAGADVNKVGPFGWQALHAAAMFGRYNIMSLLIEAGADLDGVNSEQSQATPLMMAITEGKKPAVEILLEAGANPNESLGIKSPLHIAVEKKQNDLIQILINAGAEIDAVDQNGKTPFDIAFSVYNREAACFLQQYEAKVDSYYQSLLLSFDC